MVFKLKFKCNNKVFKQYNIKINMRDEDLKWLDTKKRKNVLMELSYKKNFKGTLHQMANDIDVFPSGPDIQKLFRLLIDDGVLYCIQQIYQRNIYKIEIKKVCAIIEKLPSYLKQEGYKAYTH